MKRLLPIIALVSALAVSASATDNYEYGPDEDFTITKGVSPDGQFAITAHGVGELGYDNFHLYLTDARTGKKIGPLEEIENILDTAAEAYVAKWSKDSRTVTIVWRWTRHDPMPYLAKAVKSRKDFLRGYGEIFKGEANAAQCFARAKPQKESAFNRLRLAPTRQGEFTLK